MDNNLENNIQQNTNQISVNNTPTLQDELIKLQDQWTSDIKNLNDKFKNLTTIDSLLNEVYFKRQEAVDTYYGTGRILAERNRDYKTKAAQIYVALKSGNAGLRYTNEGAITLQIETKLTAEKECVDVLTNFTNFMKETISTIDNIIYGINNKIKVYEMLNGLKF